ncbi:MAG: radical SAM protein [Deltaproteobacteria bacterium]|nr:radical SAM protein [Deltaproteobacteria bacterium]
MPGYHRLLETGELDRRAEALMALAAACRLCPWRCGVNRLKGEKGRCGAGSSVRVAKALAHFGEEPAITGTGGSGAVFFAHCNLKCCFCQNWQISHEGLGTDMTVEQLAAHLCGLQQQGCHNINLVSAAHFMPWIVQALILAAARGLTLPVVYNSNGYEDAAMLALLDGIVDIYLPDAKYGDDGCAEKYSAARSYQEINFAALDEMFRQAGYLELDGAGIASKGLVVRHLVLPADRAGTETVLKRLRRQFGRFLSVSLMGQYRPCYHAADFPELRPLTPPKEYAAMVALFEDLGFENGWTQQHDALDGSFVPDFRKKDAWS